MPEPRRLEALTGLRVVAALHVLAYHFGGAFGGSAIDGVRLAANVWMTFFFVLSGFVLTVRYEGALGTREGRRAYFVARVARLVPLYLLAWTLAVLVRTATRELDEKLLPTVLLQLFAIHAWFPSRLYGLNDPSWSLSVEVAFYALFPFVLPRLFPPGLSRRGIVARMIAAWLVGNAMVALFLWYWPRQASLEGPAVRLDLLLRSPPARFPELVIGMGAARLHLLERTDGVRRDRRALTVALLLLLALVFVGHDRVNVGVWLFPYLNNTLTAPLFAALALSLAFDDGPIARALRNPRMVLLGEATYALYILQAPLYDLVESTLIGDWLHRPLFFFQMVALSVPISLLAHDLFERPIQAFVRARYGVGRSAMART